MGQINSHKGDGGLRVEYRITENVSKPLNAMQAQFDARAQAAMLAYGNQIKEAVRKSYRNAQIEYSGGLSSATKAIKGHSKALDDSGQLKDMVEDKGGVEPNRSGGANGVTVSWEIPQSGNTGVAPSFRRNKEFPYLFVHEGVSQGNTSGNQRFQMKTVAVQSTRRWMATRFKWWSTPRPFFFNGIKKGMQSGVPTAANIMMPVCDPNVMEAEMGPMSLLSYEPFGERMTPTLAPHTVLGLSLFFAPPSKMYAYVGAASDLQGAMRGSFTEKTLFGYLRQVAWGSVGLTGKTSRRKFRRRIWTK